MRGRRCMTVSSHRLAGPRSSLSQILNLWTACCFAVLAVASLAQGVTDEGLQIEDGPTVHALTDDNFFDFYVGTPPDTVILTLFYAHHDHALAPQHQQLIKGVAQDYYTARYHRESANLSSSFYSFFYPPQNDGEEHWYPEPVPLPESERLAGPSKKAVFVVNYVDQPEDGSNNASATTDQETKLQQQDSNNQQKQDPNIQKLLQQLTSMLENEVKAKLRLNPSKKQEDDAQQPQQITEEASANTTTEDSPTKKEETEPELTVEIVSEDGKDVLDADTFVSGNTTQIPNNTKEEEQQEEKKEETDKEEKKEEREPREVSEKEEEMKEEEPPHLPQETKEGIEANMTQKEQRRLKDKKVKFSSAAMYTYGKMAESYPIWLMPSIEVYRIRQEEVPGGSKTEVFQDRYGGFELHFWLESFLRREMRVVEYFPAGTPAVTILKWIHRHAIVEEYLVIGIFSNTTSIEYSIFVQMASLYQQSFSFVAIHMPPKEFVAQIQLVDDEATLETLKSTHATSIQITETEMKERVSDFKKLKKELVYCLEKKIEAEEKQEKKIQQEAAKEKRDEEKDTTEQEELYRIEGRVQASAVVALRHQRSYKVFDWEADKSRQKNKDKKEQHITIIATNATETNITTTNTTATNSTKTNSTATTSTQNSISRRLYTWLGDHSVPIMVLGSDDNLASLSGYGKTGKAALLAFLDLSDVIQKQVLLLRLRTIAREFKNVINVVLFDSHYYSAFNSRVGLKGKVPSATILESPTERFYHYPFDDNFIKMKHFCEDYLHGKLKPYRKSHDFKRIPKLDHLLGGVVPVSHNTFTELVLEPQHDVLIEFYQPYCGICKMMIPIFHDLVDAFKNENDTLRIAMYDVVTNDFPSDLYDFGDFVPTKFPAIVWIARGVHKTAAGQQQPQQPQQQPQQLQPPVIYEGEYSFEGLHEFVITQRAAAAAANRTGDQS